MKTVPILIILLVGKSIPTFSWELYDRVLAIVNTIPITESGVREKMSQLIELKRIKKRNYDYEKSRVLDKFIEDVLINETAQEESIFVTNKKVMGHVDKIIQQYLSTRAGNQKELQALTKKVSQRVRDKLNGEISEKDKTLAKLTDGFIEFIENSKKLDFVSFIEEIRIQMKKEQIMQIAIGISPPSKEEALNWYRKNKKKLGFEVNVKHILIQPRNRSLAAEREANKKLEGILARIKRGESFEKLAAAYSQDRGSAVNGGSLGWVNIATLDPYFAGTVFNMKRRGEISRIFKSSFGYHIVKYLGRRGVKFEDVERMIIMKLYTDKMGVQFKKWVKKRKMKSAIKIYMENYKEEG